VAGGCAELIYKEVISYETPERHVHTRGTSNSVQNHTSGMNHNPGTMTTLSTITTSLLCEAFRHLYCSYSCIKIVSRCKCIFSPYLISVQVVEVDDCRGFNVDN